MIRPYSSGDEKQIQSVEDTVLNCPGYEKEWARLVRPEWTWTCVDDNGDITGLGGMIPYEDSAYVWVMFDRRHLEQNLSLARRFEIIRFMEKIVRFAESFRLGCLWTYIVKGFTAGIKLAEFLGFTMQGEVGGSLLYRKG